MVGDGHQSQVPVTNKFRVKKVTNRIEIGKMIKNIARNGNFEFSIFQSENGLLHICKLECLVD